MANTTGKVHPNFHGVKGRSGRKKDPAGIMKFLCEKITDNVYDLTEALVQKALDGDKDCIFYCFDRVCGKPQQSTDLNLMGGEQLTAGLVASLFTMLTAKRKELEMSNRLLIEGEPPVDGEVVEDDTSPLSNPPRKDIEIDKI